MNSFYVILSIFIVWPAAFVLADLRCTHEFIFDNRDSYGEWYMNTPDESYMKMPFAVIVTDGENLKVFSAYGDQSIRVGSGSFRAYPSISYIDIVIDKGNKFSFNSMAYRFESSMVMVEMFDDDFHDDPIVWPAGRPKIEAFVLYNEEFARVDKCKYVRKEMESTQITVNCPEFCKALKAGNGSCLFDPFDWSGSEHTTGFSVVNCIRVAKHGEFIYLSNNRGETGPNVVCLKGSNPHANYTYPQVVFRNREDIPCNYNAFIAKILPYAKILPPPITTTKTTAKTNTTTTKISATTDRPVKKPTSDTKKPTSDTKKPTSDATFLGRSWFGTLVAAVLLSSVALQWFIVQ